MIAIVLIMVGAWLFSYYYDYDRVASDSSTLIPACVVSASGIFLLLVGILGFVVTFKETKWLTLLVCTCICFIMHRPHNVDCFTSCLLGHVGFHSSQMVIIMSKIQISPIADFPTDTLVMLKPLRYEIALQEFG